MTVPGEFVLPGQVLHNPHSVQGVTLKGPGLLKHSEINSLLITRAGILKFKEPNLYWVQAQQSRYYPKKGDLIVGIVTKKSGDIFKVDIGSSEQANLSLLAFEGATKKQKPDLQVGDAVYARILTAYREMEPDLVCVDSYYKAGILGPLSNDGFILNISLNLVNTLLDLECPLLETLGKKYVYEAAVGMNGKVWISAKTIKETYMLMNALLHAEDQDIKSIIQLCRQY